MKRIPAGKRHGARPDAGEVAAAVRAAVRAIYCGGEALRAAAGGARALVVRAARSAGGAAELFDLAMMRSGRAEVAAAAAASRRVNGDWFHPNWAETVNWDADMLPAMVRAHVSDEPPTFGKVAARSGALWVWATRMLCPAGAYVAWNHRSASAAARQMRACRRIGCPLEFLPEPELKPPPIVAGLPPGHWAPRWAEGPNGQRVGDARWQVADRRFYGAPATRAVLRAARHRLPPGTLFMLRRHVAETPAGMRAVIRSAGCAPATPGGPERRPLSARDGQRLFKLWAAGGPYRDSVRMLTERGLRPAARILAGLRAGSLIELMADGWRPSVGKVPRLVLDPEIALYEMDGGRAIRALARLCASPCCRGARGGWFRVFDADCLAEVGVCARHGANRFAPILTLQPNGLDIQRDLEAIWRFVRRCKHEAAQ
jgi:hypothetical protein